MEHSCSVALVEQNLKQYLSPQKQSETGLCFECTRPQGFVKSVTPPNGSKGVKWTAHGHTVGELWGHDLNPSSLTLEPLWPMIRHRWFPVPDLVLWHVAWPGDRARQECLITKVRGDPRTAWRLHLRFSGELWISSRHWSWQRPELCLCGAGKASAVCSFRAGLKFCKILVAERCAEVQQPLVSLVLRCSK